MLEVIEKLRDLRAKHLAEVAKIDKALHAIRALGSSTLGDGAPAPTSRRRANASNDIPALEAAAEETLRANGAPMKRGALVRALNRRGVTVRALDPAKYIGTVLWRNPGRFVNVTGEGFWPREATTDEGRPA